MVENKVILKVKFLQTLQNTMGLILMPVTENQQVYPNGSRENSYQFFFQNKPMFYAVNKPQFHLTIKKELHRKSQIQISLLHKTMNEVDVENEDAKELHVM